MDGWPIPAYSQHEVRIKTPFALSKFEVTYDQWDVCERAGACPHVLDLWGRGLMPIIYVTWEHTQTYVSWLSQTTGKQYRLPTEAEWEYAARGGAVSDYTWGNDIGKGRANCAVCGSSWDDKQAAVVGSFAPNAFGLFDMHGNVWEWVEDVWHDDYQHAPLDGSAWTDGGDPSFRIIRGGSWRNGSELLRADTRGKRIKYVQFETLGFRVARSLD